MARRLEAGVLAIVLAVLAVGLALVPLEMPWFTRILSASYSQVPRSTALELAEKTRAFVISNDAAGRVAVEQRMPDALAHLDDVRRVIAGANQATAALLAALALWLLVSWRRAGAEVFAQALLGGASLVAVVTAAAVLAAVVSFDAVFSAFHALFFASGTWVFPSDSLLIRLFPEPFWATAGLAWGLLVIAICIAYVVLARVLQRREGARTRH